MVRAVYVNGVPGRDSALRIDSGRNRTFTVAAPRAGCIENSECAIRVAQESVKRPVVIDIVAGNDAFGIDAEGDCGRDVRNTKVADRAVLVPHESVNKAARVEEVSRDGPGLIDAQRNANREQTTGRIDARNRPLRGSVRD